MPSVPMKICEKARWNRTAPENVKVIYHIHVTQLCITYFSKLNIFPNLNTYVWKSTIFQKAETVKSPVMIIIRKLQKKKKTNQQVLNFWDINKVCLLKQQQQQKIHNEMVTFRPSTLGWMSLWNANKYTILKVVSIFHFHKYFVV